MRSPLNYEKRRGNVAYSASMIWIILVVLVFLWAYLTHQTERLFWYVFYGRHEQHRQRQRTLEAHSVTIEEQDNNGGYRVIK